MLELNEENIKDKHDRDKYKAYAIVLLMALYVSVTMLFTMSCEIARQDTIIRNQVDTISALLLKDIK